MRRGARVLAALTCLALMCFGLWRLLGLVTERGAARESYEALDIYVEALPSADAPAALEKLVRACGGMDLYVHSSGIGFNNPQLTLDAETQTVTTNAVGFTQMIDTAFNYFARQGHGHIAAITSIAGTQGLGAAPAYSATKKYQSTYLTALAQLARVRRRSVRITDIRPGFVRTALIEGGRYPLQMNVEYAARRACRAIERRRRIAVVDWRNAILVACWRLIPRCLWERIPVYGK